MKGIIVGCDSNQEWLLPWWWENYSQTNTLPVAFCDFGMTPQTKKWCQERGAIYSVSLDPQKIANKEKVNPALFGNWEKSTPSYLWESRLAWFKKPLAMQQGPFDTGIWIDLDCEVLRNVEKAFNYIDPLLGIAIALESEKAHKKMRLRGELIERELSYNSGVVAFRKNSILLEKWIVKAVAENHLFRGDQEVLNRLLVQENFTVATLPGIYNWFEWTEPLLELPVIIHWAGNWKGFIYERGLQLTKLNQHFRFSIIQSIFRDLHEK